PEVGEVPAEPEAEELPLEPVPEPDEGEPPPEPEEASLQAEAQADELLVDLEDDDLSFWRDEAEPLQVAEAGMVVAGRYRLVEALDVQVDQILYQAEDLDRCWQCGFEGNAPRDAFCSQCGAALDTKATVRLLEVADAESAPATGEQVVERLEAEGRTFFLLARPPAEEPAQPEPRDVRLIVGQRSDAGIVRELDEDSLLTLTLAPSYESRTAPVLGLFAVADGMGGHEGGEIASKLALQVLAEHVLKGIVLPEMAGELALDDDLLLRLRRAIVAANDDVFLARQKRGNDMGTTLTAVLVRDNRLFLAHVGDCRAFRWNADGLEQLTTDHSVVASMIANGQAAPDEIYTHPHRSVIYRSIGDKPSVEVDTDIVPLAPGDRILVCSDGLWEMVRNEGIADVMLQEADPQAACDLLVKQANLAGGEDNISIVIVLVEGM
ncbi:MAG TPA: protein phosphatase 2C domain-containing protein, partial [Anaerolineae bacterium]|nr:protein phosphatase 2C domain-containing protein [Anaerolineae bacterium]